MLHPETQKINFQYVYCYDSDEIQDKGMQKCINTYLQEKLSTTKQEWANLVCSLSYMKMRMLI